MGYGNLRHILISAGKKIIHHILLSQTQFFLLSFPRRRREELRRMNFSITQEYDDDIYLQGFIYTCETRVKEKKRGESICLYRSVKKSMTDSAYFVPQTAEFLKILCSFFGKNILADKLLFFFKIFCGFYRILLL